jgi:CTP-dependent riboflavin kinase
MNGFVKIYRSLLEWEWWDDINTFRLFMTILLLANWKEKKWHGKTIARGSLWTSLDTLSKESGLTIQQTRTALEHLKSTGEITDQSTNDGRLITVENYSKFQDEEKKVTSKVTSKLTSDQQTANKRLTTTEEYKELFKKGEEGALSPDDFIFFRDFIEEG